MKKLLLTALISLAAIPAFAAENEAAFERVINTGTLKCGYGISPPALVKDPNTGKLSGMNYDIWEQIGKKLDIKIEWVESGSWATFPEDLRQGKYDAYCSDIWMTPARTKFLSASIPVSYTFLNAYVRADDTRFGNDIESFNNENITIPVVEGDITEDMVKTRFSKAKTLALPGNSNWGDLYLAVTTKKADVFFTDAKNFEAISKTNPVKLRKVDAPPVYTFGARFSVASGEIRLRDMIDVVLQSMIDDGSLKNIAASTSPYIVVPDKNYSKKGIPE